MLENLNYNTSKRFDDKYMDTARTINTQITLPIELYQALAVKAQADGQSVIFPDTVSSFQGSVKFDASAA
jgi:hypothetical protein